MVLLEEPVDPRPGPSIVGNIDVQAGTFGGYLRQDITARGFGGHLIWYWYSAEPPAMWRAEDVTATYSAAAIAGDPAGMRNFGDFSDE